MRNQKKLLITALSLILCLTVSIGIAAAYFTDYESARGGAILNLSGQTELTEKVDKDGKTISIQNVDKPDMVVRVMIIADKSHLGRITLNDNWTGPDENGWYYYGKVLKGSDDKNGDSTTTLRAEVNVSGDEDINNFDVVVVHEAEIAVYDGDTVIVPEGWTVSSISAN